MSLLANGHRKNRRNSNHGSIERVNQKFSVDVRRPTQDGDDLAISYDVHPNGTSNNTRTVSLRCNNFSGQIYRSDGVLSEEKVSGHTSPKTDSKFRPVTRPRRRNAKPSYPHNMKNKKNKDTDSDGHVLSIPDSQPLDIKDPVESEVPFQAKNNNSEKTRIPPGLCRSGSLMVLTKQSQPNLYSRQGKSNSDGMSPTNNRMSPTSPEFTPRESPDYSDVEFVSAPGEIMTKYTVENILNNIFYRYVGGDPHNLGYCQTFDPNLAQSIVTEAYQCFIQNPLNVTESTQGGANFSQ